MTLALFPGSFDPVTNGHVDLILRAGSVFDQVVVAVGANASKRSWLPVDQRVRLIEAAIEEDQLRARVISFSGLLAELAADLNATAIVKGVRTTADLDSEAIQAQVNHDLCGIQTVLLPATSGNARVSSSLVRELFFAGAQIDRYVPPSVAAMLEASRPAPTQSA